MNITRTNCFQVHLNLYLLIWMKLLCHSSINSTHLAVINVLKNKNFWVLFSPPSLNPPPLKKTPQSIPEDWEGSVLPQPDTLCPVGVASLIVPPSLHTPPPTVHPAARTYSYTRPQWTVPYCWLSTVPRWSTQMSGKKNNQYIHVFPSSTLWYRMACITCTKKSISLPPS